MTRTNWYDDFTYWLSRPGTLRGFALFTLLAAIWFVYAAAGFWSAFR